MRPADHEAETSFGTGFTQKYAFPILPSWPGGTWGRRGCCWTGKEVAMRPYERPTLTAAGSFKKMTGIGGTGPKDALTKKQSL